MPQDRAGEFLKFSDAYSAGMTLLYLVADQPLTENVFQDWVTYCSAGGPTVDYVTKITSVPLGLSQIIGSLLSLDVGARMTVRKARRALKLLFPRERVRPIYDSASVLLG